MVIEQEYLSGTRPDILSKQLRSYDDLLNVANPELTILTPSYNTGRFLEDTIRSIANQSFRNFEHIVIDGASKDQTVEILKKYPHIRWVSEKDNGYPDAFRKGLNMARGKYIIQCCVSDGFANQNWFKYCVDNLNQDPELSLVCGYPQYLTEDGIADRLAYPGFRYRLPEKDKLLSLWLLGGFGVPEGNLCVRKEVLDDCYPKIDKDINLFLDWNKFNLNFFSSGYLAKFLPVAANFGRTHVGNLGQRERISGLAKLKQKNFYRIFNKLRKDVFMDKVTPKFIDSYKRQLPYSFNLNQFRLLYIANLFSPNRWWNRIKLYWYFLGRVPYKLKQIIS